MIQVIRQNFQVAVFKCSMQLIAHTMKQIAGDSIIQLNIKLSQFRQLEHTIFDLTTIVDKQHISENSGLWKTSNIKQQSHMIQPMDPYQLWEERAIHLQVGGQQQAMGHKSRLQQRLQSPPHKHSMQNGTLIHTLCQLIQMVDIAFPTTRPLS